MSASPEHPAKTVALARQTCRFTAGGIWLYQGLVPKLLGPHTDEIAMTAAAGIDLKLQATASYAAGAVEIMLGICILALPRQVWPQSVSAIAAASLLVFVMVSAPGYLAAAFNPVVMNSALTALSVVAVLLIRAGDSV